MSLTIGLMVANDGFVPWVESEGGTLGVMDSGDLIYMLEVASGDPYRFEP